MTQINFEVPEDWDEEAESMDLTTTEYVRHMVRAGRRQFGVDQEKTMSTLDHSDGPSDTNILKEFVETNLSTNDAQSVDDLQDLLRNNISSTLDELSDEDRVDYQAVEGGWVKVKDDG